MQRRRTIPHPTAGMHFFTIRADAITLKRGGAYVNCWIKFRLYEGALLLAKYYVREEGWRVRAVTEHQWMPGRATASAETVRYFDEAERQGACLIFHRYPRRQRHKKGKTGRPFADA